MGLIFVRMPKIWLSFQENRFISLAIGLASYSVLLTLFLLPNEMFPFDTGLVWGIVEILVKWSWIALIIGFARKYLNYTNSSLKYCNSIVYPFFILHQTVIIIFGFYVIDWGMSGTLEFLTIVVGTFVICALLYELLIKRVNILRLLFGMSWQNKESIVDDFCSKSIVINNDKIS
jgi:hypothetical protein